MKGKYINRYVEMACLASRNKSAQPDIHRQLKETIAALKMAKEKYIHKKEAKQTWMIVSKSDAA